MDYYCNVCTVFIKPKNKYKHFKSKSPKDFDKCENILLSLKDIDIKEVDEAFYLYFIGHYKKFEYYLVKGQFQLVFNDYQNSPYITSKISDNKTMIFLVKIFRKSN